MAERQTKVNGVYFLETLKQQWRGTLFWGIALGAMAWLVLAFIPDMEAVKRYEELLKTLPPAILQAFGFNPEQQLTPESFLGSFLFTRFLLLIGVYGVLAGLDITINEEDNGIMEVVLALPVSRTRLLVERFAAFALLTLGLVGMMYAGIFIGTRSSTLELNMGRLFEATLAIAPVVWVIIAVTMLLGVVIRRKVIVIGVAAGVVLSSYFLDALGGAVTDSILNNLRWFSFFAYADTNNVLRDGISLATLSIPVAIVAVLLAGTVMMWQRRDLSA
jgi:ABC-2 type transport system permease protein